MNREKMKMLAKRRLDGRVVLIFAMVVIMVFVFTMLGMVPVIGRVGMMILAGPVLLSFSRMLYLMVMKNRRPEIDDLMYGLEDDNFLRGLVGYILYDVYVFLWSLLLVIPGIIKAISYSQMFFIMAEEPGMGADEARKKSMAMMEGRKMDYFVLQLSFIPWHLAAWATFGVLYIWVVPYIMATNAAFYREVRKAEKIERAKKLVLKVTVERGKKGGARKQSVKSRGSRGVAGKARTMEAKEGEIVRKTKKGAGTKATKKTGKTEKIGKTAGGTRK